MSGRSQRALVWLVTIACVGSVALDASAKPRRKKPRPSKPAAPATPAAASATPAAQPDSTQVTVVEVAGGEAFLEPGASAGVRRGATVTFGNKKYVVSSSTSSYAVVELGRAAAPAEGETGTSSLVTEEEDTAKALPPPRPLATLEGQWGPWRPPAEDQHPKPVPLGVPDHDRRYDLLLYAYTGGLTSLGDRGSGFVRSEVGMRLHVEPFSRPLMLDVDGSVQRWFGPGIYDRDGARPMLRVRELQLGYGDPNRYFAGLGRIRYAASTLGALDGLRLQAPLGSDFSVSAFGGVLPDPLLGSFTTESQRFGVEMDYQNPRIGLRPEAAVVVNGSTYDGRLDERRVAALAAIYPGQSRLGAHAEVSAFDEDNPWGVDPVELSAAGLDGTVRAGVFQFGARADLREQERSRFLASYLPAAWLCTRVASAPAPAGAPEACDPRATTLYQAGVDAGLTTNHFAMFVAGFGAANPFRSDAPTDVGVLANARVLRIFRALRLETTGTASSSTYANLFSGSIGPGVTAFGERLDAAVYFRHSAIRYRAGDPVSGEAVGAYATVLPFSDFVASLQGEGTTGDDLRAVMGSLVLVWRPRL